MAPTEGGIFDPTVYRGGCIAGGWRFFTCFLHDFGWFIWIRLKISWSTILVVLIFMVFGWFSWFVYNVCYLFLLKTVVFLYKSLLGISESDFFMKLPYLWYWRNEFVLFFIWFFNFFNFWGSAVFLRFLFLVVGVRFFTCFLYDFGWFIWIRLKIS